MRYSREHKAGTRNRIVQNASHALRRRGLNGIGIVGLMKTAGLTRGGFYSHFKSREALVAEAVAYAMGQTASEWRRYAGPSTASDGLEPLVAAYLRREHRDNPARGCPLPAVSADIARSGEKVRRTFTQSPDEMLDALAAHIPDRPRGGSPVGCRRDGDNGRFADPGARLRRRRIVDLYARGGQTRSPVGRRPTRWNSKESTNLLRGTQDAGCKQ